MGTVIDESTGILPQQVIPGDAKPMPVTITVVSSPPDEDVALAMPWGPMTVVGVRAGKLPDRHGLHYLINVNLGDDASDEGSVQRRMKLAGLFYALSVMLTNPESVLINHNDQKDT